MNRKDVAASHFQKKSAVEFDSRLKLYNVSLAYIRQRVCLVEPSLDMKAILELPEFDYFRLLLITIGNIVRRSVSATGNTFSRGINIETFTR